MDTLRRVESVCPVCCEPVPAAVLADERGVYMEKSCPEHGPFSVVLSRHSAEYRELHLFYDSLIRDLPDRGAGSYIFYVTARCNLGCPICFTRAGAALWEEPSLDFIKGAMSRMRGKRISLFGGEPTVRKDLPEIMRVVHESGNEPVLFTNGIAVADLALLRELKERGLREVHLQFDGFDDAVYQTMRGRGMLETKLAALANLRSLAIPTVLEATIARGVNEGELAKLIDYAVANPFVRGVAIKSYVDMGAAGLDPAKSLRGDELLDLLSEQTGGRISNRTVVQLHKLLYSLFNVISQRWCSNEYLFFLQRRADGKGFDTINEALGLDGLEPRLERFRRMRERRSPLAAPYFLAAALASTLRLRSLRLLANVASLAAGILLLRPLRALNLSPSVLFLEVGALCSPDNFERERAERCAVKQLTTRGEVGMCLGNMEREREIRRQSAAGAGGRRKP